MQKLYDGVLKTLLKTMDLAHKVNDKLDEIIVPNIKFNQGVCQILCIHEHIYDNDYRYGFDFNDDDG